MLVFVGRTWHFLKLEFSLLHPMPCASCCYWHLEFRICVNEWSFSFCLPSTILSIPEIVNQTLGCDQGILEFHNMLLPPSVWNHSKSSPRICLLHCWHIGTGVSLDSAGRTFLRWFLDANCLSLPRGRNQLSRIRVAFPLDVANGSWNSRSTCRVYSRQCRDRDVQLWFEYSSGRNLFI